MRWPVAAVLGVFTWALLSGTSQAASFEEIESCLAANVPKKSSVLTVMLRSRHVDGLDTKHQARIYGRSREGRAETLLCMAEPLDVRGLAYLLRETDAGVAVWGYLPEKHQVIRIHASAAARRSRIARTAISYDDLRYLPINVSSAEPGKVTESVIADRKVSVVQLSPPPGEDALYARIVAFIDQETCVPLRIEFYETTDKMLKILKADPAKIQRTGNIRMAHAMSIQDLKQNVVTALRVENAKIGEDLDDSIFSPNQLQRNHCRRLQSSARTAESLER